MKVVKTADGSNTIYVEGLDEHYHSVNGALTESQHVFINSGLLQLDCPSLKIFEIGFGTGLNCFLTALESERKDIRITFETLEKYPVSLDTFRAFYSEEIFGKNEMLYKSIVNSVWGIEVELTSNFTVKKIEADWIGYKIGADFDLIYMDAFGPDKQPEMWSKDRFEEMYRSLRSGGILVTYSAKGAIRRMMSEVGFRVERLPGPPGKREMLRAIKP